MPTHVLGMFLLQCQVPEEKRRGNAPKRRRVSMAQQKIYNTGKEKAEEGKNVKDPLERRGRRKGNWYLLRLLPR